MSLRNVTLTAVAALSLGMAANAQTTMTVPLNEPGTEAPAPAGPGTTVTRDSDGTSTVETNGAVPRPEGVAPQPPDIGFTGGTPDLPSTSAPMDTTGTGPVQQRVGQPRAGSTGQIGQGEMTGEPADTTGVTPGGGAPSGADVGDEDAGGATDGPTSTPANPEADATADERATPDQPAPAADIPEPTGAEPEVVEDRSADVITPTPTAEPGEPPAAPSFGMPDEATEAQAAAPVPAAEGAVEADAPDTDVPASPAEGSTADPQSEATGEAAPAAEADAAAAADAGAEAEAGADAGLEVAPGDEAPAAIQNPDEAQAESAPVDTAAATETEGAEGAEGEVPADHGVAADGGAAVHHQEIHDVAYSFEGPFGKYDQFQLQRGLQIYTEVCSGCHGMKQVPLRTLSDHGGPGLPEDQVRAYAAQLSVVDAETGEERPRVPTDHFPQIVGQGMGPDLSLMAKARAGFHGPYGTGLSQLVNGMGGPEYIYSILTGYTGNEKEQAGSVLYENTAFPGGWISMAPPLSDDAVTFEDGSPTDLHSLAKDISAFLMWTAEPKMMARKQAGLVSVLFLIVLSVLLYLTNKRLWWPIKHRKDVPGDGF